MLFVLFSVFFLRIRVETLAFNIKYMCLSTYLIIIKKKINYTEKRFVNKHKEIRNHCFKFHSRARCACDYYCSNFNGFFNDALMYRIFDIFREEEKYLLFSRFFAMNTIIARHRKFVYCFIKQCTLASYAQCEALQTECR